jgi:hypothetical protein
MKHLGLHALLASLLCTGCTTEAISVADAGLPANEDAARASPADAGEPDVLAATDAAPAPLEGSCLDDLPETWEDPPAAYDRSTALPPESGAEGRARFNCARVQRDVLRHHEDILGLGAAYADMKPGMILQGDPFKRGVITAVPLPRSGATLSIDVPGVTLTRSVAVASSASLAQAIGELQREAAMRFGEFDIRRAELTFDARVVSSFEEAMTSIEANASFSAGLFSGGFSSDFGTSRSRLATTVVAKLTQRMFTINFADDELATERDFFAPQLTAHDFEQQCIRGVVTPTNPPVYVKSVEYGRIVVFQMTTEEAISERDLEVLVRGSFGGFSGDAAGRDRFRSVASRSSIKVLVMGGTQDDALAAIRDGDMRQFFMPAPPTTAVPLKYRVNYLRGARPTAKIGSALSYVEETCSFEDCIDVESTASWDFTVRQGNAGGQAPVATAVDILPGDDVTITAGGNIWAGVFAAPCNGPSGWTDEMAGGTFPLPGAAPFSLIGRIGPSGWMYVGPTGGAPWRAENVAWAASLELATNDDNPSSGDDCPPLGNTGFTARVFRSRVTCEWRPR